MFLQGFLAGLQSWGGGGIGEDIALSVLSAARESCFLHGGLTFNQFVAIRSLFKSALQGVGMLLAFQFDLFRLEGSMDRNYYTGDRPYGISFGTYGAALVSSRICLFFKSWTSGLCWRCFSSELRLSIGEIGVVSTLASLTSSDDILSERYLKQVDLGSCQRIGIVLK